MPEVQPSVDALGNVMSPPEPRAALFWDGTHWRVALVAPTGHVRVDVMGSALPAGAATAANQALMVTALQLIDNLVVALGGPGNARLIVRGEDQLSSYNRAFVNQRVAAVSGADGYCESNTPSDGEVWVVTNIVSQDSTTATSLHRYNRWNTVTDLAISEYRRAMGVGERGIYGGWIWLEHDDVIRVYFTGALAGDTTSVCLSGFVMTKEV